MSERKTFSAARLVWGLLLVVVGAILMLDRMNVLVVGSVWRFWPVGMIGMGLGKLLQHQGIEGLQSGLWLMVLGGWLLVVNFGVFGLSIRNSWPILTVAFGAYLVWQALMPPPRADEKQEVRDEE